VILNLVKNAAQAMALAGTDAPRITLSSGRHGKRLWLSVEDNGPGITETVRRRVFEPFFTTKEVGVGTGLGLSVSYFIITEQHRGSLRVETRPGHGARFVIELPIDGNPHTAAPIAK
jgi:signal transduction histidine kinase